MEFKKIILIILSFSILLNISYAASNLQIVVDEITPLPVEPGEDMTIKVRLENIGDETANDVEVERIYDFPFRLEYELQEKIKVGNLDIDNSKELTFYITVSPKAKSGVYPLTFNIKEGITTKTQDILINVVGNPDIIFDVDSIQKDIIPGESFKTSIKLTNIGTGNARNIKINSDYDNFAFKDSSLIYIDDLRSEETKNLSFDMIVDSSIKAGLYQIPITIEMIGENGQQYISNQKININVIDSAQVALKEIKIKPAGQIVGKPISVEIRTENIGVGSADNVYIELKFEDGTSITGTKKAYIGHLDINDESPAFFTLNSKVVGKYPAKILIHYTDDLGEHTTTESLNLSYKEDTSTNYTLYGGILLLIIMGVIIKKNYK